MHIPGYAYSANEAELQRRNQSRYEEIKHLLGDIELDKTPEYGGTSFRGRLETDEARALDEFDLALLADHGNLCFGGCCTRDGDTFSGMYFVD